MNPTPSRKRIGRWNDVATRQRVYQSDDALEVDEIDHFEIIRKRVYFEDVLLVTTHQRTGLPFVITMAVFFALLAGIGAAFQSFRETGIAVGFAIASVPFLLVFLSRMVLKQEVITVYGRRSKASMKFTFRKTYARDKFEEICSLVAQAQERSAAEQRAMEPPPQPQPPSDIPMPPADIPMPPSDIQMQPADVAVPAEMAPPPPNQEPVPEPAAVMPPPTPEPEPSGPPLPED